MHQQSAVLADVTGQSEQEIVSHMSSNYFYPEFAGPGGERYLKKLLRQVLPMALYRTWEIFTDYQARGNDCYLGIFQLAALAGRSLRTMQKNIASLQAKQLLIERTERKVFRGPQGEPVSRLVVVKDFANLYALAHEYHEWLHADAYIAPDRAFVASIMSEPSLVGKLRRFNNYRRVLYTRVPGPGPREQEENRWFSEYHPERLSTPETAAPGKTGVQPSTWVIPPQLPPKHSTKEVAKDSPKRRSERFQGDVQQRDSFDSAVSFSISSFGHEETGRSAAQARQISLVPKGQGAAPSQTPDHPLLDIQLPFADCRAVNDAGCDLHHYRRRPSASDGTSAVYRCPGGDDRSPGGDPAWSLHHGWPAAAGRK